ncbi:MAG: hypothetical protein RLZZ501_688 [Pseudomonadota bacterium]|jgi:TonB family protein
MSGSLSEPADGGVRRDGVPGPTGVAASLLAHALALAVLAAGASPPAPPPPDPPSLPVELVTPPPVAMPAAPAPAARPLPPAPTPPAPTPPTVTPPAASPRAATAPAPPKPRPPAPAPAATPQPLAAPAGAPPAAAATDDTADGAGAATGTTGPTPAASGDGPTGGGHGGGGGDDDSVDAYLADLRLRLQRALIYPAKARRLGLHGEVRLRLRVRDDGRIDPDSIAVLGTPPDPLLANAAIEAARRLALASPPRPDLVVVAPITFRLE